MSNNLDSNLVSALSRRLFLRRAALTLGAATVGLPVLATAKECGLTEQEILGPMYNYGAPSFQVKLADDNEPGQKLMLRGTVYSADCRTPLPAH